MGKVQSTFINTYPGAISRSVDDIVISLTNGGAAAIKFGAPVFPDTSTKVARNWASGDAVTGFIGIATRIGIKTPDTYASSEAEYAVNDIMSVIVRGSVCVKLKTGATAPSDCGMNNGHKSQHFAWPCS